MESYSKNIENIKHNKTIINNINDIEDDLINKYTESKKYTEKNIEFLNESIRLYKKIINNLNQNNTLVKLN